MGQKITVVLTCDLDDADIPAAETVHFSYGGNSYALELCETHLAEFTKTMEHYSSAARKEGKSGRPSRRSAPHRRDELSRQANRSASIRDWARSNGFEVNDRGRIPAPIRQAWEASQDGL